jgi:hypothetical protein
VNVAFYNSTSTKGATWGQLHCVTLRKVQALNTGSMTMQFLYGQTMVQSFLQMREGTINHLNPKTVNNIGHSDALGKNWILMSEITLDL